jgi:hypothetical protein
VITCKLHIVRRDGSAEDLGCVLFVKTPHSMTLKLIALQLIAKDPALGVDTDTVMTSLRR